jgi:hypothetical protein
MTFLFSFFIFFLLFFFQNIIISPGKFADGGSRNPARVLTKLGWPLDMKTAVSDSRLQM